MRNSILVGIAVLIIAGFGFYYLLDRTISQECRNERSRCIQECDRTRDRAINENRLRRTEIQFQLNRDLLDCRLNNLGNQPAIEQCQNEVTAAAQTQLAQLDVSDNTIRAAREQCVATCREQARRCDEPDLSQPGGGGGPGIEIACIEGNNAPCFKEVLEICTVIAGPCDNCWESLCGDGQWTFESDTPLDVTLVAARDPKKSPRVLSTSSLKGKQAVLAIPAGIKLSPGERLYFGFSSKEKPSGPVKAVIRRSK